MKKLSRAVSLMLALALLFTGCSLFRVEETPVDVITFPSTTEPPTTEVPATEEETSAQITTVPATTEAPATEPKTEPVTYSSEPVFKGYTSKGYEIIEKGGVTYVDGVLIANKTYALPASYGPGDLTPECRTAFNVLVEGAAADGIEIFLVSGYRSYTLQDSLYRRYCAEDGQALADTYSARPGHSEHQSGLAIDVNSLSYSFADTAEGKWLAANAHKYGFIIRYAKDKQSETGYSYEPWHIRYLGVNTATAIYNSGLCLEEYYGITSVYQ